jgi:hypothetical protein
MISSSFSLIGTALNKTGLSQLIYDCVSIISLMIRRIPRSTPEPYITLITSNVELFDQMGTENLAPTGICSLDCPVCSELLYGLRHSGPLYWSSTEEELPCVMNGLFCQCC